MNMWTILHLLAQAHAETGGINSTIEALNVLVTILVAIFCVGAIPFGYSVTSRLSSIETKLEIHAELREWLIRLDADVQALKVSNAARIRRRENGDDS